MIISENSFKFHLLHDYPYIAQEQAATVSITLYNTKHDSIGNQTPI